MGKIIKYFSIALTAALAAIGIAYVIRKHKETKNALPEGQAYEDSEPSGCCGAEFTDKQKKTLPKEESGTNPEKEQV